MRVHIAALALSGLFSATQSFAQSALTPTQMERAEQRRCIVQCLGGVKEDDRASRACFEPACAAPGGANPIAAARGAGPDRERVAFVQRRLGALGFDAGPVDGVMGRRTLRAIRAYRRSQGLAAVERIDEDLMSALRTAASRSPRTIGRRTALDVPVMERCGDGQAADSFSSTVAGLNPRGDGFLAVRSGPGTNYRKIDELHNGDVVFTFDGRGDWHGIAYDAADLGPPCPLHTTRPVTVGKQGWVHGKWLRDLAG